MMNLRKLQYLEQGYYKRLDHYYKWNVQQSAKIKINSVPFSSFRKKIKSQILHGLRSSNNIFVKGNIRLSSVMYEYFKNEFNPSGRFKNSNCLHSSLNLIRERYFSQKEFNTFENSSFVFRIAKKRAEEYLDMNLKPKSIHSKYCFLAYKFMKTEEVKLTS